MARRKVATKTVRRAPASRPAPPAGDQAETSLYEVLTPFKFRGSVLKPPAFVEMTADEARPHQDAGVLGTDGLDPEAFRGREGEDDDTNT